MKKQLKGIWELRRENELASGKKVVIYSAFPLIGRGSVIHNTVSNQEVEAVFEKALQTPLKHRFSRWICKVLHG